MPPQAPFACTWDMLEFILPINLAKGNDDLFMVCSFSLTLLMALIALLIPNRRAPIRRIILIACAALSAPSFLLNAGASIWVYGCINYPFVFFGAPALIVLTMAGLWLLSRRYEQASRMRAFLRILAIWPPIPLMMVLVELVCHLIGYQFVVS